MLEETNDTEELIERVAALDIGKAELVCCVRVPGEGKRGRRLQEARTYTTMTRSLLVRSIAMLLLSRRRSMTGSARRRLGWRGLADPFRSMRRDG